MIVFIWAYIATKISEKFKFFSFAKKKISENYSKNKFP